MRRENVGPCFERPRNVFAVIPGHREAMSPESITTIGSMDSGLALRAPRNDGVGRTARPSHQLGRRRRLRCFARRSWPALVDSRIAPAEAGQHLVADGAEMMREFVDGDAFAEQ